MIKVTWEWLGQGEALDLANTVAIVGGAEHDLLASKDAYERWADAERAFLPPGSVVLLRKMRSELLELRTAVRDVLAAASSGGQLPIEALKSLNQMTREAPRWVELDLDSMSIRERALASPGDDLLARYAHSALELIAHAPSDLTRCPAPSCGMFYVRSRAAQRWCSPQCGSRARVARHYDHHRAQRAS